MWRQKDWLPELTSQSDYIYDLWVQWETLCQERGWGKEWWRRHLTVTAGLHTYTHRCAHPHTMSTPHTHRGKRYCLFVFYVWRAPFWNYSRAFLDFQCWNLTFLFLQCMWPKYLTLHVIYLYHDNIILHREMLQASFVTLRRKAKDTMAIIYHPLLPRPSPRRILCFSCSELVKASLLFLHYLLWIPTPSLYNLFFPFHVSSLKADTHLLHASACLSTWGMLGASWQTLNMDYLKQNASVLLVQV